MTFLVNVETSDRVDQNLTRFNVFMQKFLVFLNSIIFALFNLTLFQIIVMFFLRLLNYIFLCSVERSISSLHPHDRARVVVFGGGQPQHHHVHRCDDRARTGTQSRPPHPRHQRFQSKRK